MFGIVVADSSKEMSYVNIFGHVFQKHRGRLRGLLTFFLHSDGHLWQLIKDRPRNIPTQFLFPIVRYFHEGIVVKHLRHSVHSFSLQWLYWIADQHKHPIIIHVSFGSIEYVVAENKYFSLFCHNVLIHAISCDGGHIGFLISTKYTTNRYLCTIWL